MDDTANLKLPYIVAAQAQKHVTHNEALRALDAVVQLMVLDKDLSAPPGSPAEGDRYLVAASPTGAWAGQAGKVAAFQDGAWAFYEPQEGWIAWIADDGLAQAFDGADWVSFSGGISSVNPVAMVGVNATADATNRLAVASPASLFNHEGAGHQVKINKAAPANTASLVFQTGFSGRAEYGLAGDDDFHVKVSPDGTTWHEAIVVDKGTGEVSFPNTSLGGGGGGGGLSELADDPSPELGGDLDLNGFEITGLVPGTDIQPWDADLAALAALTGTNTIYYRSGSGAWSAVSVGSLLSFAGGTLDVGDATLAALAGLAIAQGSLIYGSGADAVAVLAKDTSATRYLANTGASNNPAWAQIDLSNGVAGDLPFANIAQIATSRLLGRMSASTGDIEALNGTQATALLDSFAGDGGVGGAKGLVPAPAAGDAAARRFLKADGTWAQPDRVLLNSGTLSSAATLDVALTSYGSLYRGYALLLANIIPATDNVTFQARVSTDGGSNFDAGSSDYYAATSTCGASGAGTASSFGVGGNALSAMTICTGVGNDADGGVTALMEWFDNLNTAIRPRLQWRGAYFAQDNNHLSFSGGGRRNTAQDFDALRIMFSSGNIASGKWALYGYA